MTEFLRPVDISSQNLPPVKSDEDVVKENSWMKPINLQDEAPLTVTGTDGETYTANIIDGDTTALTDSQGNTQYTRDADVNTSERIKEVEGLIDPGTATGETQRQFVEDAVRYGGYNLVDFKGEKGAFDRPLTSYVNAKGESVGDLLIAERIADPNKYTTREQMFMRSSNQLQDMVNFYNDEADSAQKARDTVNSIFRANPIMYQLEQASSKQEFQEYEFWRSHSGISELKNQLASVRSQLEDESLTGEQRDALEEKQARLQQVTQEMLIAPPKYYGYVGQSGGRRGDKGFFEEVQDSLIGGIYQLEGNAASFVSWAGDFVGAEGVQEWGQAWATDNAEDINRFTEGNQDLWTIGGAKDGLQFAANTIAQYGPQLGVILGAGRAGALAGSFFGPAGAAIGATVGSLGASFVLAVSSIYDEQPEGEKDPYTATALAIPVMLLEKYGADQFGPLASKLTGKNVLTKDGADEVIATFRETFGETTEQATKRLNKDIFELAVDAGKDVAELARDNLIARQGFRDLIFHTSKSIGREAVTEALQEGIQAAGIAGTTSVVFDYKEVGKRMIESGIVGGIAGAPFGVVEGSKQNSRINQIIYDEQHSTRRSTESEKIIEDSLRAIGGEITIEESIKRTREEDVDGYYGKDGKAKGLKDIADPDQATYLQAAKDVIFSPLSLLTSFKWNIVKDDISNRGDTDVEVAEIASMLGELRGIHTGNSIPTTAKKLLGKYLHKVSSEVDLANAAGVSTAQELDALRRADPSTLSVSQQQVVAKMKQEETDLVNNIISDLKARGVGLSPDQEAYYRDNYFDNIAIIDPSKMGTELRDIVADMAQPGAAQEGFFGDSKKKKLGKEFADEFIENLRNNPTALATIQTTEALGLGTDPRFANFRSSMTSRQKIPVMAQRFASRVSREGVEEYFVKKILKSKMSAKSKAKMAAKLQQYMDMLDGNFGKIDNNIISSVQDHALLFSQLAYMDTNFFANSVDLVYGMLRIQNKADAKRYFGTFAKAFAKGLHSDLTKAASKLSGGRAQKKQKWEGKKGEVFSLTRLTGHVAEQSETLQIEGANVSGQGTTKIAGILYKANMVENYTDSSKAAVSTGAWDDIMRLVSKVADDRSRGINSEGTRHAMNRLRGYNVPIDRLVELHNTDPEVLNKDYIEQMNDPNSPFYQEIMNIYQTANINYIDEFTARPETGSSSKLFEDERFRLFTQYKRFITHFTANIIPTLWNRYIQYGSPQVRYQVFQNIMLTFVMAYTAQALKDLLRYGEEAPYLDDWEEDIWDSKYGRAIRYTGWAGSPEIAFESILKYRDNQFDSHPEKMSVSYTHLTLPTILRV